MAKIRNMVIRNKDQNVLERLRKEYTDYVGRETRLTNGVLVVFARTPGKKRTPKRAKRVAS